MEDNIYFSATKNIPKQENTDRTIKRRIINFLCSFKINEAEYLSKTK
ncbi:hypothetical protein HME9304_01277 [Flagellimonas maritima]|uniref:Uncharacterized protein n=1 Tax=Flagellimonas maritima TaxID=1383885 RepID=A0A2Z4LSN8_9FLAO|nr:hypothetical protein HME9304_01277 [Allomuricauda aurantiaca]